MGKPWGFDVLPGDARQTYMRKTLCELGFAVDAGASWPGRRALVLPFPCKNARAHMLKAAPLKAGDAVVGTLGEAERQEAAAQGVHVVDPAVDEAFAIANALPTVEGAIMLGIAHTAATLHGALVLVLGYGRIGSLLVHRLLAFGAHVIVCSREERELAWATAYGCHAVLLDALDGVLSLPSLVYNTIPGPVLDERRLTPLLGHAAVIELASAPGGCADDPRVIKAGGLPGKTAPKTAAEILCEAILRGLAKLPPM